MLVTEAEGIVPKGFRVHQLLCGRDVAKNFRSDLVHQFAVQMANYIYVVEDVNAKTAVVVDPAWDVDGLVEFCGQLGLTIRKAVFSHHHPDHVGGKFPRAFTGMREDVYVPGLADFADRGVEVFVGTNDVRQVAKQCGVGADRITAVNDGDVVVLNEGGASLKVFATPGHTPGSVVFGLGEGEGKRMVLFTGDTLFIGSCGRVDLPDSSVPDMLASLQKLSTLHEDSIVLPGHNYASPAHSTIGEEKSTNGMMIQAIDRFNRTKGRVSSEPVAAMLPLPNYLGVARKVFQDFQKGGKHEEECPFHDHGKSANNQFESHF